MCVGVCVRGVWGSVEVCGSECVCVCVWVCVYVWVCGWVGGGVGVSEHFVLCKRAVNIS